MFENHPLPDSDITNENCSDPLAFDPVPCRRRDGWTAEKQRIFIESLSQIGLVGEAAKAAGMSRKSAYRLRARKGAESFAETWDFAISMGEDNVRSLAIKRCINGVMVPRYRRGRVVGQRLVYDNRLLERALNAHDRSIPQLSKDLSHKKES